MASVLVVEDNVELREVTLEALRRSGYEASAAGTLDEARSAVFVKRPDVVVLDARLPDGDGLELARQWSCDAAMGAVPIIVWTAFSSRQDLEAALLARVDAFLVKPCTWPVLAAHIQRVLCGDRPSRQLRT